MTTDSIPRRFLQQATDRPNAPGYHVREASGWRIVPWRDYVGETRRAAQAMIAAGLEPGDTVCILGFNRPEWVIFATAAMMIGAAAAGIYTTCSADQVAYIVGHAESKLVLVENEEQSQKVHAGRAKLAALKQVIAMRDAGIATDAATGWDAFLALGDDVDPAAVDERVDALENDQLASLIYTSGTTGPPKAVMLTHRNLAWTAGVAVNMVHLAPEDRLLSYLPLSHIAEQMFTMYGPMTAGSSVYFAESLERVKDNLAEARPTVFFGVPRIWEKFHAAMAAKMDGATGLKRRLLDWAMPVARAVNGHRNASEGIPMGLMLQFALAKRLIYDKVKAAVGLDAARVCVVGAAPIARAILEFFEGLDIPIREVYGQSEDCGPTSFNLPGRTRLGTVGPPIPGMEVKIAEDGEIVVRGPNVFAGYYKDPEATAETLIDGWLHSGDLGEMDADGFLRITGRKKEIIITAGGKNITPRNIEEALQGIELVQEAMVVGDRRKFLSALLTLDADGAAAFAREHGLEPAGVHQSDLLQRLLQAGVDGVNARLSNAENIRKFRVLPRNFSLEDGELTPTLKLKRRVVAKNFDAEIESMYAE